MKKAIKILSAAFILCVLVSACDRDVCPSVGQAAPAKQEVKKA